MDVSKLSDYQLFELSRNKKLDPAITQLAGKELKGRQLTEEQMGLLLLKRDRLFKENEPVSLQQSQKIVLMIFPLFRLLPGFVSSLDLPRNRTWKGFWRYVCVGYVIWIIGIYLLVRLFRG